MKLYIVVCIVLFMEVGLGSRIRESDKRRILTQHNSLRQQLANGIYNTEVANMKKMTWSTSLQDQMDDILSCNMLTNSRLRDTAHNVGQLHGRRYQSVIQIWFHEIIFFRPEYQMCINSDRCTNVLKIIKANNDQVGCSIKRCPSNRNLFGCLYKASTESFSPFPLYKPGKACTKCEGDSSFCENGLCVPCDTHQSRCDCRKTCHKPLVGSGTLNTTTCQCQCRYGMGPNCDVECINPEQYEGWDICALITPEECASPDPDERSMLAEFCPEQCSCQRYPTITT